MAEEEPVWLQNDVQNPNSGALDLFYNQWLASETTFSPSQRAEIHRSASQTTGHASTPSYRDELHGEDYEDDQSTRESRDGTR